MTRNPKICVILLFLSRHSRSVRSPDSIAIKSKQKDPHSKPEAARGDKPGSERLIETSPWRAAIGTTTRTTEGGFQRCGCSGKQNTPTPNKTPKNTVNVQVKDVAKPHSTNATFVVSHLATD
ncbi:hypothetical protein FN846DRAFT_954921 [Sphaerosporella brunnea]|uniref:Secreted protein n=1 Tax=Sphaerosporella brunnea TaxID=1250544 RepID=A0A5J5EUF8_9PEZI|nr:hypothetical protein FN846DRAFT_954921 [Sphaerosporella brunnea]